MVINYLVPCFLVCILQKEEKKNLNMFQVIKANSATHKKKSQLGFCSLIPLSESMFLCSWSVEFKRDAFI